MASFGPVAAHYDVLMANVPYDMWAGYYRLLLSQIDLDPTDVLDVCCGTGTVAELMADAGYAVTGFDLSAEMVAVARAKEAEFQRGIVYEVADATSFDFGRTFEGAYSFFDSLNYIASLEGLRAAVARVGAHLEAGGSFIFDVNTAYAFEQEMFDQSEKRAKAMIRYEWKGDYDPETRMISVDMRFWRGEEEFREVHVQRAHSDREILEALRDGGFDWVRSYDSYTLDPPNKQSDRVHYVALKGG